MDMEEHTCQCHADIQPEGKGDDWISLGAQGGDIYVRKNSVGMATGSGNAFGAEVLG
jgi:hypothetical protein